MQTWENVDLGFGLIRDTFCLEMLVLDKALATQCTIEIIE